MIQVDLTRGNRQRHCADSDTCHISQSYMFTAVAIYDNIVDVMRKNLTFFSSTRQNANLLFLELNDLDLVTQNLVLL